ncbi:MAG TPA: diguanylate cyclase, partial [Longimicrobiales bacterium]|nr:diguanylate cyclase [Longimicrobiales bacterium]
MVQDAKPKVVEDRTGATSVPPQALLLSLLSLWVPVLSSSFFPAWTNEDVGILVWLLALVPAFLLSYYRGWRGASLSLAGAMAAFTLAQVVVLLMGSAGPPPDVMVGAIAVLVTVALGSGWISSLFQHSLAEAEEMAFTDPLTGLANRRHALTDLRRAFAAAQRGAGLSVVLFDLDRFKRVNDRFGHGAGDEVLARFGAILRETTREMDLAGRFGGEEFLSVLNGQDVQGAIRYGERVLEKLRGTAFAWGRLTVSAGVATYEPGMASADVLVAAADQALYRAKKAGRDRVAVLGPSGAAVARRRKDAAPIGGVGGSGELVLAVDDDPAVLRVITLALRRNGYRVAQATDPEEAVRIARGLQEPPALVLTDVVMPQMSGFRLVEILSEFLPSVRVVYISGYEADDVEWSGAPGEIRAFLPKPIAVDAMMAAVRDTLDAQPPAGR